MPILIVTAGIILLIILITVFKIDAFISFIIVGLIVGLLLGMSVKELSNSIQSGIGSTLGFLAIILVFGAMLGKMVAVSGAARRISLGMMSVFGEEKIRLALMISGFIVGIPMFFSVGFIILVPLIFTIAATARIPLVYAAVPMIASLSVTHGLLPPHPAPVALVGLFEANMGKTLIYGIIIGIPVVLIAGLLFSTTLKKYKSTPLKIFYDPELEQSNNMPGLTMSLLISLFPVILLGLASVLQNFLVEGTLFYEVISLIGDPIVVMLLAVAAAVYFLGVRRGLKIPEIMSHLGNSVKDIALIMLIIGGAGALNQIMYDSGVSNYIAENLQELQMSALVLGWLIAALIRIAIGSATVAAMTSAGIIAPFALQQGIDPNMLVLSIGAGSLILGHVN
ncbi:MAG: TRAP transporter large permease subunit, partial [Mariniphaga sp.]|nr:TRAP transporter large permease subunit [Mariniphaga sp.]